MWYLSSDSISYLPVWRACTESRRPSIWPRVPTKPSPHSLYTHIRYNRRPQFEMFPSTLVCSHQPRSSSITDPAGRYVVVLAPFQCRDNFAKKRTRLNGVHLQPPYQGDWVRPKQSVRTLRRVPCHRPRGFAPFPPFLTKDPYLLADPTRGVQLPSCFIARCGPCRAVW